MKKQAGFTLLEILIALFIFAILGVLAALSLHRTMQANVVLNAQDKQLTQLQLTVTLIRRDLLQAVNRSIIDSDNQKESAFSGSSASIQFTRMGLVNPFGISNRTDMQRVGYRIKKDVLERLSWNVLDQAATSKPLIQNLLSNVTKFSWSYVTKNNQIATSWPPGLSKVTIPLPKAVLLKMTIKGEGEINGVFPIPAQGVVNATTATPTT